LRRLKVTQCPRGHVMPILDTRNNVGTHGNSPVLMRNFRMQQLKTSFRRTKTVFKLLGDERFGWVCPVDPLPPPRETGPFQATGGPPGMIPGA